MREVSFAELARVSLNLIAGSNVPATDETLALAIAARTMLKGIANGTYIVAAPPQKDQSNG